MKVYLATSWSNPFHADAVRILREAGHEVYNFKEAHSCSAWEKVGLPKEGPSLPAAELLEVLYRDQVKQDFQVNFDAMQSADACVLLLPSGRASHIEAGWMAGAGKHLIVVLADHDGGNIMELVATKHVDSIEGAAAALAELEVIA